MSDKTILQRPTLTVLVQTFQGEIAEQCRELRNAISHDLPEVNIIGIELALGRYNMLVRLSGEEIGALTNANRKIALLKFVQNTASFVTYSAEIVPNEIEGYRISSDAKQEILQYLGRMQQSIVHDVYDVEERLDTLLILAKREVKPGITQITSSEIRLVERELDRRQEEERFKRRVRTIAAIIGTCLIIPPIVMAIILMTSMAFNFTFQILAYMLGLSTIGGILLLIAVDYERVSATIGFFIGKH